MILSNRIPALTIPVTGLILGSILAMQVCGRSTPDQIYLKNQQSKFLNLPSEQQNTIRKSYALFNSQSETRRSEIAEIFQQTQSNSKLAGTLEQFAEWWPELSQSDWDSFRNLSTEERLQFVSARWTENPADNNEITIEFPGPPSVRLPTLHLSFEEFWTIISTAVPASKREASLNATLEQLSSNKHRALCLTLNLFESFQNQTDPRDGDDRGKQFTKILLSTVRDKEWASRFSTMSEDVERRPSARPWAGAWLYMTIFSVLDKATLALGEDLRKQFSVTSEQMIEAFASLQDKSDSDKSLQRSLMTMSPDEARKRLELLAQTQHARTPEEVLLTQYNEFLQKRQTYMRRPFGMSGPGAGTPGDGNRPPRPPGRRTP
jgi:hypothetical protein